MAENKLEKKNPFDTGFYSSMELNTFGFKSIGQNVLIAKNCTIIGLKNIEIGNNVRIDSNTTIVALSGPLQIRSYVHIAGHAYINSSAGVYIEDFVGISHGSALFSANDDYSGLHLTGPLIPTLYTKISRAPITLEKHVVIGASSVILPGVTIHQGSIVGALSLVKASLPEWGMYSGVPVKLKKKRSKFLLNYEQDFVDSKTNSLLSSVE